MSIISFVDDGLFISQNKSLDISNSHLFCSYNVMTKLFERFSLIVEYSKTEVFYFNRLQGSFNPPCYESKLKGLSNETTLVLSNTRELDRVPSTK